MANIPRAGFPNFSAVSYGKGKSLPNQNGLVIQWYGMDHLEEALGKALVSSPKAMTACLTELGLFGERETKLRTPVQYGVLRASIGHFDAKAIKGLPDEAGVKPDAADAVFVVAYKDGYGEVTWGTNVKYGPWIEWGFTMATRRVVYIPKVGFRWVNPFSYRGAHMFEQGMAATMAGGYKILAYWANKALTAGGLPEL